MKNIKNRTILLIGGAGFIGHNLAMHLKSMGANVIIVDSLGVNNIMSFTNAEETMENKKLYLNMLNERQQLINEYDIPIYIQDARDYHAIAKLFDKIKPNIVVQLAAVSHADKSNKDPYNTFDHSLRTLENALDSSKNKVEHFIYFSSSMVYGNFKKDYVDENTICDPIGIYAALKFAGEKLVKAYNQVFDLPYTIVRPSALYGERCVSRRVGQIFIENALTGKEITLNGDGFDRLDFTYIGDLVRGIQNVIENDNAKNQIFNLTYGEGRSLADMVDIMKEQFSSLEIKYQPKDKLTPDRGTLSVEKAKRLINYCPKSPLEKGYLKYINWYKEFYDRFDGTLPVQKVSKTISYNHVFPPIRRYFEHINNKELVIRTKKQSV